jgi:hypothetical protein
MVVVLWFFYLCLAVTTSELDFLVSFGLGSCLPSLNITITKRKIFRPYSLDGFWLADSNWCWFVVREKHCWMTGWFWLIRSSEQAVNLIVDAFMFQNLKSLLLIKGYVMYYEYKHFHFCVCVTFKDMRNLSPFMVHPIQKKRTGTYSYVLLGTP